MWRICGMEDDINKSPTSHVSNGYLCLHDLSVLISHHMYVLGYYLFFLSFGSPVQTGIDFYRLPYQHLTSLPVQINGVSLEWNVIQDDDH
ncbi:hypothetical protein D5086_027678 [Populus alba]|uniref:Uncharacterized protein n=1 Tax=Populus alba TaxID=43335 RepID=A0ACC4AW07_POPAL